MSEWVKWVIKKYSKGKYLLCLDRSLSFGACERSACCQEGWGVLSCGTIGICVAYGTPLVKTFSVPLNRCNSNLLEGTTSIIRWAPTGRAPRHLARPLHTVPDMCHVGSQSAVLQCHDVCQTSHRFGCTHSHTHKKNTTEKKEIQFMWSNMWSIVTVVLE